jgi:hypothetical protein
MPLPPRGTPERLDAERDRDKIAREAARWLPGAALGSKEESEQAEWVLRAVWRAGWTAHERLGK